MPEPLPDDVLDGLDAAAAADAGVTLVRSATLRTLIAECRRLRAERDDPAPDGIAPPPVIERPARRRR